MWNASNATLYSTTQPRHYNGSAPSCERFYDEFRDAVSELLAASPANVTVDEQRRLAIEGAIEGYVVPAICLFGILGNVLNLVVLTRKSLTHSMDYMEKSAYLGLVGLAVSDLFFCVVRIIECFLPEKHIYFRSQDWMVELYYHTYHEGLINLFIFSSTWLTVIVALGRYVAVCHPLHARGFINLTATRISICAAFFASAVINIPRFLKFRVSPVACDLSQLTGVTRSPDDDDDDGVDCPCHVYHKDFGTLYENKDFTFYYHLCWSTVAVFLPLAVLTVCNVCLVRALRQSSRLQMTHRANRPRDAAAAGRTITPTLVVLVLMFIVLVVPSGVLGFFGEYILRHFSSSGGHYSAYMLTVAFVNCLVVVNFAVNFVLYCVINAQFRRTVVQLCSCGGACGAKGAYRPTRLGSVSGRFGQNTAVSNLSEIETEL